MEYRPTVWEVPPSLPRTIIKKVNDVTVMKALAVQLVGDVPEGYFIKELVPRQHDNGWLVIMEPRALHTPAAL